MKKRIVVAGGGAAGMTAAIAAGRAGADVLLLEKNKKLGKKLSQTGNGRCNYTNLELGERHYRSQNPAFPGKILERFGAEESIAFLSELGIVPRYRGSYVYPSSDQAASVTEALEEELCHLGVRICLEQELKSIRRKSVGGQELFILETAQEKHLCDALILACGSCAAPVTGSDGSGYLLAESMRHSIIPVVPALSGLRCSGRQFKELAGVRVDARLRLLAEEKLCWEERGELQLTDYGISGIPVFQFSRFAAYALLEKKRVHAVISFLPDWTEDRLHAFLLERQRRLSYKRAGSFLCGLLNGKLSAVLLSAAGISPGKDCAGLTEAELRALERQLLSYRVSIASVNPFQNAQCAAGGVDTSEIDPKSMESRLVKNLYFAGEILDVDGICGGYNLQFAWASGFLAGKAAAEPRKTDRKERASIRL